jgi:hypothetical protein
MSIWFQYNNDEKLVMLQQTAASKNIVEQAVEKDFLITRRISKRQSALRKNVETSIRFRKNNGKFLC